MYAPHEAQGAEAPDARGAQTSREALFKITSSCPYGPYVKSILKLTERDAEGNEFLFIKHLKFTMLEAPYEFLILCKTSLAACSALLLLEKLQLLALCGIRVK